MHRKAKQITWILTCLVLYPAQNESYWTCKCPANAASLWGSRHFCSCSDKEVFSWVIGDYLWNRRVYVHVCGGLLGLAGVLWSADSMWLWFVRGRCATELQVWLRAPSYSPVNKSTQHQQSLLNAHEKEKWDLCNISIVSCWNKKD